MDTDFVVGNRILTRRRSSTALVGPFARAAIAASFGTALNIGRVIGAKPRVGFAVSIATTSGGNANTRFSVRSTFAVNCSLRSRSKEESGESGKELHCEKDLDVCCSGF